MMGASSGCLRQQVVLRRSFLPKPLRTPPPPPPSEDAGAISFAIAMNADGIGFGVRAYRRLFSSEVETALEYERDQPYHEDGKVMEKDAALHLALSRLAGDFGKESMLSLQRFYGSRYAPVISTGSLKLDLSLGIGGLPKGRVVEIYGREASGKTTLGLQIVKEAQKLGGYCAYFDLENAMDPSLAEAIGVNTEDLLLARPNCAENSLSAIDTLVKSGSVDVIVVDSVAALLPQHELDGEIGFTNLEQQSRLMTHALRKIHMSLCRSETLLIFINQVTGLSVSVQVMKNKLAPATAMKKAELEIGFGKGICREAEVLEIASNHGVILKKGNGYLIDGYVFKDKVEAQHYLAQNNEITEEIVRILRNQLLGSRA